MRSKPPPWRRECLNNSQQLTEQGPRRHHHWIGATETINRYERDLNYCLKSMFCLRLMLEVGQRVRQSSVAGLYLDQKPGLAIAHDEKIHLAFELVAQVTQLGRPQSKIRPTRHRFEQMAGDKRLRTLPGVVDS